VFWPAHGQPMSRESHQGRARDVDRMKTEAIFADENWSLACIIAGVISIPAVAAGEVELIRTSFGGRRDLFGDLIAPHLKPVTAYNQG
jgi:hypothetical protein